jgi:AbiU2
MHLYELVRLCAVWDKPRDDRESIPTILALLAKPEVIETLVEDTHRSYATDATPHDLRPTNDPVIESAKVAWWQRYRIERADEQVQKVSEWIATAREQADAIIASAALKSLREFRDAHIAHNLSLPETPAGMQDEVRPVRYGDETILDATVDIVDALHLALNGTSFDWEGAREIASNNARDLWNGCRFEVPNPMRRRGIPG